MSLLSSGTSSLPELCESLPTIKDSVNARVCQSCCVSKALFHWCLLPLLPLKTLLPPLLQSSLSPEGRHMTETSHLLMSVPRFLMLCTLSSGGSLNLSHLLQEEMSRWWQSRTLMHVYSRMTLGYILFRCSFNKTLLVTPITILPLLHQYSWQADHHCRSQGLQLGWC